MPIHPPQRGDDGITPEEFKRWLRKFDTAGDGRISTEELRSSLHATGAWFSTAKAKRGLGAVDKNSNGLNENEIDMLVVFAAKQQRVRGLSKDISKNIAKEACSVQLHELDANDGHVSSARAREVVGSVHVPASINEQSAALQTNKNEDHKVPRRDVAMRGIVKKKD